MKSNARKSGGFGKKSKRNIKQYKKISMRAKNDLVTIFSKKEIADRKQAAERDEKLVCGCFSRANKTYGFVTKGENSGDTIFIPPGKLCGAMHGDMVKVRLTAEACKNMSAEGEIVEIMSRGTIAVAGRYKNHKTHGELIPYDKRFPDKIYVPKKQSKGTKSGELAAVRITEHQRGGRGGRMAHGEVFEKLGSASSLDALSRAVLYNHGVRMFFPKQVLAFSDSIDRTISPEDIRGRLDLRGETIFTIDGAYAKDFDDAVSIEKTERDNYILGVHIADVTHYVKEGSVLDEEAFLRGSSVYFSNKVIPMLPKALSNDLCSLVPNEDRLTLSCIMEIRPSGEVVGYKIRESVIKSCERLVYDDISLILSKRDKELSLKYEHILPKLLMMGELARILRKRRSDRGCLDFDLPEAEVVLDEKDEPVDIIIRQRGAADNMIEEFMLAANETVARHCQGGEIPIVYRVHEPPTAIKAEGFLKFIGLLGIPLPQGNKLTSSALLEIQNDIKGKKEERAVLSSMLRALSKAKYSENNRGHFGLASEFYCHFTSPIRRYSDLASHRAIKAYLKGTPGAKHTARLTAFAKDAALQSTITEIIADETERSMDDLYKTAYMKKFVGDEFDAVIASVGSFGFFVELENTVRGLVDISSLEDYYIFNEEHLKLIGKRRNKTYSIGDTIKVRLIRADIEKRELDFVTVE